MEPRLLKETENDAMFSKELFFQHKVRELCYLNWDNNTLKAILEIQFQAQKKFYNHTYPEAENLVIFIDNNRVGKLIIDKTESYHIIDISIKSEYQSKGIGTHIIKKLILEAGKKNNKVTLTVAKNNPAQKLYNKLGFNTIEEDDLNLKMST